MLNMAFGIPIPSPAHIQANAVAWARFQQEFPQTRMTRKMSVILELATTTGVMYMPLIAGMVIKARQAADARKKPRGFDIPKEQPVRPEHRNGAGPAQATPTGNEFVIGSGVMPDKGRLDFGA